MKLKDAIKEYIGCEMYGFSERYGMMFFNVSDIDLEQNGYITKKGYVYYGTKNGEHSKVGQICHKDFGWN